MKKQTGTAIVIEAFSVNQSAVYGCAMTTGSACCHGIIKIECKRQIIKPGNYLLYRYKKVVNEVISPGEFAIELKKPNQLEIGDILTFKAK